MFTSPAVDTGPSMRQLCGGNVYAIEKLLTFGKELRTLLKEMKRESATKNKQNETLMKVKLRSSIFKIMLIIKHLHRTFRRSSEGHCQLKYIY